MTSQARTVTRALRTLTDAEEAEMERWQARLTAVRARRQAAIEQEQMIEAAMFSLAVAYAGPTVDRNALGLDNGGPTGRFRLTVIEPAETRAADGKEDDADA